MNILYSYNKRGFEADYWFRELSAATDDRFTFIPFNHDRYLADAEIARWRGSS